jgi:hypothetical protein
METSSRQPARRFGGLFRNKCPTEFTAAKWTRLFRRLLTITQNCPASDALLSTNGILGIYSCRATLLRILKKVAGHMSQHENAIKISNKKYRAIECRMVNID